MIHALVLFHNAQGIAYLGQKRIHQDDNKTIQPHPPKLYDVSSQLLPFLPMHPEQERPLTLKIA